MKINNEKTQVEETKEMNDLDYLSDILESTKNMVKNYSCALTEASNMTLYKIIYKVFDETSLIQRKLFNLMFEKGWYTLETAPKQATIKSYDKFSKQMEQL